MNNMTRASICISSDSPAEEVAFEEWLEQWVEKLTFVSGNYGCGCCVQLYDVEGPQEAIDTIPKKIRSRNTKWVQNGEMSGDPDKDIVPKK